MTESIPVIPGLDTDLGIVRMGGSPDSYLVVLKSFCVSNRNKLLIMKEFFMNGDIHNLTISCHALKSAFASIGAERLSEAAAGLEAAGVAGDTDYLREFFMPFYEEIKVFNDKLDMFFESGDGKATKKAGSQELLREKIGIVLEAVRNLENDEAEGIINQLLGYTFSEETDRQIKLISECLACFDDMGAEEICAGILEAL